MFRKEDFLSFLRRRRSNQAPAALEGQLGPPGKEEEPQVVVDIAFTVKVDPDTGAITFPNADEDNEGDK